MKTPFRFALVATLLSFTVACGDNEEPADVGADVADTDIADTESEDTGVDVPDASDDAEPDADESDADPDAEVLETCEGDGVCSEGYICIDEVCESLRCGDPSTWDRCEALFNRIEPDMGRYATCTDFQCRIACYLDDDCGDGEICTDFGYCRPFTGDLSVPAPFGPATGDLQAGVSNLLLNYPMGTPQGGFGTRAATNDGRYAASLRATSGQLHGLYGRAVVLDNGERQMMFIRLPVIFTQAGLHEAVARALQEETGKDWRHDIVISSTHTHSGPCRHWHLPEQAAAPLGSFGIGESTLR